MKIDWLRPVDQWTNEELVFGLKESMENHWHGHHARILEELVIRWKLVHWLDNSFTLEDDLQRLRTEVSFLTELALTLENAISADEDATQTALQMVNDRLRKFTQGRGITWLEG